MRLGHVPIGRAAGGGRRREKAEARTQSLPAAEAAGEEAPGPVASVGPTLLGTIRPAGTRGRPHPAAGGRAFGWLTVMPALLVAAWCLPGLPLLLSGRFEPTPMVLISVPLAVGFALLAARHVPGRWAVPAPRTAAPGRRRRWAGWLGLGGTALVAAGFGAWQFAFNSPQYFVIRDPGVLAQFGYWAAEHGSLPVPGLLSAFGASHHGVSLASFGFAAHGGGVLPLQAVGLPIVLATGLWAHGVAGGAILGPVLGALAVLSVGGLAGRLAGPQWAPLAALALALTLPEVYTSRSAFGETLLQVLLFGGLSLIVDSLVPRQRAALPDGTSRRARPWRAIVLGVLGGLSLGLTVLVTNGFLLVLLPVIPFGAVLLARRQAKALPFGIGFVIGAGYGLAGSLAQAPPATRVLGASPRTLGLLAAGFAVLTLLGEAVGLWPAAARLVRKRPLRWLAGLMALLVVAAVAGFAARPYLQVMRGGSGSSYVLGLQRLAGLAADPRRTYAEDSLYWVVWYLGVPALVLAVIGLAVLARRCFRGLLDWQDSPRPGGSAWAWTLPFMIVAWGAGLVLWQPGTVPDQPWASRTLVPVVLPGLLVCGAWAAAWLTGWARERRAGRLAASLIVAFFVLALTVPAAITTFAAGATGSGFPGAAASGQSYGPRITVDGVALGGIALHRTGQGELAAVQRMCAQFGSNSTVLILDQAAGREFAPVIRGMCQVPVGVVAGVPVTGVQAVVGSITQAGRRPVLVASLQSELAPYLSAPRRLIDLSTAQDAHVLIQPPAGTWPARYVLWVSSPGTTSGA